MHTPKKPEETFIEELNKIWIEEFGELEGEKQTITLKNMRVLKRIARLGFEIMKTGKYEKYTT